MVESRLKPWDYVSMVAVVVMSSCFGIYHLFQSRKQKMVREFLIVNKDVSIVAIVMSLASTYLSAVTILGNPAEVYTNGIVFSLIAFSIVTSSLISSFLYLPVLYNLGTSSVYEYLQLRFNKSLRLCASSMYLLQMISYSACVVYAPSLTLELVVGIPLWASIASVGIVCILYTSLGGIKAVVWMDACQFIVMIVICLAIFIKGTIDVGGLAEMWRISSQGQRTDFFVPSSTKKSTYSTWTMLTIIYNFISRGCASQMMMQRYSSNKSLNKARISAIGGAAASSILLAICCFTGLVIYARYHACDPLLAGKVTSRDQILPLFVLEITSSFEGLMGIFVSAIICATLSTLSSTLNSASAITMADFIRPFKPNLTESSALKLSKIITLLYGLLCVGLVAVIANTEGLTSISATIMGLTNGPIATVFTIGMLLPWINNVGAILGFLSGFLLSGWAFVGRIITKPVIPIAFMETAGCDFNKSVFGNESFTSMWSNNTDVLSNLNDDRIDDNGLLYFYSLHSYWYQLWSLGVGLIVAIIASLLTGFRDPDSVDPKLIFPFVTNIIRRLKKSPHRLFRINKFKEITELRGDTLLGDTHILDETAKKMETLLSKI